jgi:predicted acetyltransferase
MRCYVACDGSEVVAALYHIPCKINEENAHYLFGAATLPSYRRRGVMRHLIEFSLEDARANGDKFSVLYPAEDRLYKYYEKLGYKSNCSRKTATVDKDELMHIAEYSGFCISMGIAGMSNLRNQTLKANALKFNQDYMKYSVACNKLGGGYTVCSDKGYALVQQDKFGECVVSELIANENGIFVTLGELLKNTDANKFTFNYPVNYKIFPKENVVSDGMIYYLSDLKLNNVYIGLRNE